MKRLITYAVVAIVFASAVLLADRFGVSAWLRSRSAPPPAAPAQKEAQAPAHRPKAERPRLAHPVSPASAPLVPHAVEAGLVDVRQRTSAGIVARPVSSREVELSWGAPDDGRAVAAYEVVRDGRVVATSRSRGLVDGKLTAWSEHCYAVRTLDGQGLRGALPGMACVRMPDTTPPTVPGGLVAEAASDGDVVLAWEASHDDGVLAGYEVLLDGAVVGHATWRSGFVSHLEPATVYCFAVRAFDEAGNRSEPSGRVCAQTLDVPRARRR